MLVQKVLKMGTFGRNAKGVPFEKFSKSAICFAELRKARKKQILVGFQPNWYGWTRNLFQFITLQKQSFISGEIDVFPKGIQNGHLQTHALIPVSILESKQLPAVLSLIQGYL